jgi:ornithine cyclodeaminase/alanine dehydrogenase-like protein (mu-crystallin family)
MAAALTGARRAAVKWASVIPPGAADGVTVKGWILLCDTATGAALALIDGTWITAARTAAMSAVGAKRLARAGASAIAFVGCGVQARSHLEALARVLPGLKTVTAFSRTRAGAERFAANARALGFEAAVEIDPRRAVAGHDVVVTSVPAGSCAAFVDPAWFAPQSFVAAVDLGRSIKPKGLERFAVIATDDRAQSEALGRAGRLLCDGPFAFDLAELAEDYVGATRTGKGPVLFVFAGHALADLAVAEAVYVAARASNIGVLLPA